MIDRASGEQIRNCVALAMNQIIQFQMPVWNRTIAGEPL